MLQVENYSTRRQSKTRRYVSVNYVAEPRRLTYFASKSVVRLGGSLSQEPKK